MSTAIERLFIATALALAAFAVTWIAANHYAPESVQERAR